MRHGKRGGYILVLVISVVALLAALAFFYLSLTQSERRTAHNWSEALEARFLAQSGLEKAFATIKAELTRNPYLDYTQPLWFPGEDVNRNGFLDEGEDLNGNGVLDISSLPLDQAPIPSLPLESLAPGFGDSPDLVIRDRKWKISARLPAPKGFDYAARLKIIDASSKINWGQKAYPSRKTLINNLGLVLGLSKPLDDELQRFKSTHPFVSEADLLPFLSRLGLASPINYFTFYSWLDPTVIQPKPIEERPAHRRVGQTIFSRTWLAPGRLSLEPRPPININTANFAVLAATMARLEGTYLDVEEFRSPGVQGSGGRGQGSESGTMNYKPGTTTEPPFTRQASWDLHYDKKNLEVGRIATVSLSLAKAMQAAKALIEYRNQVKGFSSWQALSAFLHSPPSGLSPLEADLVLANANPNTDLNKFNPSYLLAKKVDKSDLRTYTTEWSLYPTGNFEIESLGLIVQDHKEIVSEYKIALSVNLYNIVRDTSEADFAAGEISQATGPSTGFFTRGNRTFEIYPEARETGTVGGRPSAVDSPAVEDGQLLLALLHPAADAQKQTFYAPFDRNFTPLLAQGKSDVEKSRFGNYEFPAAGNLMSGKPVYLYPDGVFLDPTSSLTYSAGKNFPTQVEDYSKKFNSFYSQVTWPSRYLDDLHFIYARPLRITRGTIRFWFKPAYDIQKYKKVAALFTLLKPEKPDDKDQGAGGRGQGTEESRPSAVDCQPSTVNCRLSAVAGESTTKLFPDWPEAFKFYHYFTIFTTAQPYQPQQNSEIPLHAQDSGEWVGGPFFHTEGSTDWDPTLYASTQQKMEEELKDKDVSPHHWIQITLSWSSSGLKDPLEELKQVQYDPKEYQLNNNPPSNPKPPDEKSRYNLNGKKPPENPLEKLYRLRLRFINKIASIFSAPAKQASLYIDGRDVSRNFSYLYLSTVTLTPVPDLATGATFTLGARHNAPRWNTPPEGTLDNFEILDHPLSDEEALAGYQAGHYFSGAATFTSRWHSTRQPGDNLVITLGVAIPADLKPYLRWHLELLDSRDREVQPQEVQPEVVPPQVVCDALRLGSETRGTISTQNTSPSGEVQPQEIQPQADAHTYGFSLSACPDPSYRTLKKFRYRLTLYSDHPVMESPVIDDVTLFLFHPPQFIYTSAY